METAHLLQRPGVPDRRGVDRAHHGLLLWGAGGTQLGSETYPALAGINTAGGEFAFVPGTPCEADFNGDNQVDFFDYLDFVAAFDAEDAAADFNGDNQVDFFDYLDFAAAFDEGCD